MSKTRRMELLRQLRGAVNSTLRRVCLQDCGDTALQRVSEVVVEDIDTIRIVVPVRSLNGVTDNVWLRFKRSGPEYGEISFPCTTVPAQTALAAGRAYSDISRWIDKYFTEEDYAALYV